MDRRNDNVASDVAALKRSASLPCAVHAAIEANEREDRQIEEAACWTFHPKVVLRSYVSCWHHFDTLCIPQWCMV